MSADGSSNSVEAAFYALPLKDDMQERARLAIQMLSRLGASRPIANGKAFRAAGRATCQAELNTLAKAADALTAALDDLHGPTINALADVRLLREPIRSVIAKVASAARAADVSALPARPPAKGRRENLAYGIGGYLAKEYRSLTGLSPTVRTRSDTGRAHGPFLKFVKDVFAAMGIANSPEAVARAVIRASSVTPRKKGRPRQI